MQNMVDYVLDYQWSIKRVVMELAADGCVIVRDAQEEQTEMIRVYPDYLYVVSNPQSLSSSASGEFRRLLTDLLLGFVIRKTSYYRLRIKKDDADRLIIVVSYNDAMGARHIKRYLVQTGLKITIDGEFSQPPIEYLVWCRDGVIKFEPGKTEPTINWVPPFLVGDENLPLVSDWFAQSEEKLTSTYDVDDARQDLFKLSAIDDSTDAWDATESSSVSASPVSEGEPKTIPFPTFGTPEDAYELLSSQVKSGEMAAFSDVRPFGVFHDENGEIVFFPLINGNYDADYELLRLRADGSFRLHLMALVRMPRQAESMGWSLVETFFDDKNAVFDDQRNIGVLDPMSFQDDDKTWWCQELSIYDTSGDVVIDVPAGLLDGSLLGLPMKEHYVVFRDGIIDLSKRGTDAVRTFPPSMGADTVFPHLSDSYKLVYPDRESCGSVFAWLKHEPDMMYDVLDRLLYADENSETDRFSVFRNHDNTISVIDRQLSEQEASLVVIDDYGIRLQKPVVHEEQVESLLNLFHTLNLADSSNATYDFILTEQLPHPGQLCYAKYYDDPIEFPDGKIKNVQYIDLFAMHQGLYVYQFGAYVPQREFFVQRWVIFAPTDDSLLQHIAVFDSQGRFLGEEELFGIRGLHMFPRLPLRYQVISAEDYRQLYHLEDPDREGNDVIFF